MAISTLRRYARRGLVVLFVILVSGLPTASAGGGPPLSAPAHAHLDVLFIGAHPDDEAFSLATFGQWNEYAGVKTGVVTITRGEGGGNAAGPQEGPDLGILREAEERRAVAVAGIRDIFYPDKVDFYYTVSAPLTEELWGHRRTLERIVRVIRETRPQMLVTMNPSPTPGNHGNHQYAARLAIEAFYAAANPAVFPAQITREGLAPWRVKSIYLFDAAGTPTFGPNCAAAFVPAEPTDNVFSVWTGRPSARYHTSWAEEDLRALRNYVSQGWSVFPDVSSDPMKLPCASWTLVDSRVPFMIGDTSPLAMLKGAVLPPHGGLPLGTEFSLSTNQFDVIGGQPFTVVAHARAAEGWILRGATVALHLPAGWTASGSGVLGTLLGFRESTTTFTVTPPANAPTNTRVRVNATLSAGAMTGTTNRAVEVAPAVRGVLQPLPQVAQFQAWTHQVGLPQLNNLLLPVASLGSRQSRAIQIDLTNVSNRVQSGTVTLRLPAGFMADAATKPYSALAPHGTGTVTFQVTNTNGALKTSNQGGVAGAYMFSIVTTSARQNSVQQAALELVPVTTIPHALRAPTVDGVEAPGEYSSPSLDLSRVWEGQPCASPRDCSASGKVTWSGDALYVIVHVTDNILGTVLPLSDCKRHWRTDAVEIAIDPRGTSENTSTTFKTGILPITRDPAHGNPPCWERDADNHQGPGRVTAPGMIVAAKMMSPYHGYTVEAKIPLAGLPAAVDPQHLGLNIFIYDSDTQDKTGKTRIGWSTWPGVQGDPYRWGHAILAGYTPPPDRPIVSSSPIVPNTAAQSVASPQSILQAATDGTPLAGGPAAGPNDTVRIVSGPTLTGNTLTLRLAASGPGTARLFAWTGGAAAVAAQVSLAGGTTRVMHWLLPPAARQALAGGGLALVGFQAADGGTTSLAQAILRR